MVIERQTHWASHNKTAVQKNQSIRRVFTALKVLTKRCSPELEQCGVFPSTEKKKFNMNVLKIILNKPIWRLWSIPAIYLKGAEYKRCALANLSLSIIIKYVVTIIATQILSPSFYSVWFPNMPHWHGI